MHAYLSYEEEVLLAPCLPHSQSLEPSSFTMDCG